MMEGLWILIGCLLGCFIIQVDQFIDFAYEKYKEKKKEDNTK